jgi:hypothetical protein
MLGNLSDLAATGLASENTLRKWIAAEPDQAWILKRGSNGDAYEIDIEQAAQAYLAREEAKRQEARDRAQALRQLGFNLGLGAADESQSAVELSIAERRQLLEEEVVAIKLARLRGELVPFASVQGALGDVLVKFQQLGRTFSARLAKKTDFSRDQLAAIDRLMEADHTTLADLMEKMEDEIGDGGDSLADPAAALEDSAFPNGR